MGEGVVEVQGQDGQAFGSRCFREENYWTSGKGTALSDLAGV